MEGKSMKSKTVFQQQDAGLLRKTTGPLMRRTQLSIRSKNEQGIALVMALVMIVILSILGSFALSTSTTELRISGNFRNAQSAFFAADAALDFASVDSTVRKAIKPGTTETYPVNGAGAYPPLVNDFNKVGAGTTALNNNGGDNNTYGYFKVRYVKDDKPPTTGEWLYDTDTNVHYVVISAIGVGPNATESTVEALIGWI